MVIQNYPALFISKTGAAAQCKESSLCLADADTFLMCFFRTFGLRLKVRESNSPSFEIITIEPSGEVGTGIIWEAPFTPWILLQKNDCHLTISNMHCDPSSSSFSSLGAIPSTSEHHYSSAPYHHDFGADHDQIARIFGGISF